MTGKRLDIVTDYPRVNNLSQYKAIYIVCDILVSVFGVCARVTLPHAYFYKQNQLEHRTLRVRGVQTARVSRLVCAFVVRLQQSQAFIWFLKASSIFEPRHVISNNVAI